MCQDPILHHVISTKTVLAWLLTNTIGIPPPAGNKCGTSGSHGRKVQGSTYSNTANNSEQCPI